MYVLTAKIPGLGMHRTAYALDPTHVVQVLIETFGTDVTVCREDSMQSRVDWFRERKAHGALQTALNDARHRGPCWTFRVRTGTDQIVFGQAERYVVNIKSHRPIPDDIAHRFTLAVRELRFEPLRLCHEKIDGNNIDETPVSLSEPSWAAVDLFPRQGDWSEGDYLRLDVNRHVELVDGRIEIPPHPADRHQEICGELLMVLRQLLVDSGRGIVVHAPFPVRLRERTFRMPDLCFVLREHRGRRGERFWNGADLVVEVTSEDSRSRDWHEKKRDYAAAGIPEYWIADPRDNTLTIFTLDDGATEYRKAGRYKEGETAASVLLEGLTVEVAQVFAAE